MLLRRITFLLLIVCDTGSSALTTTTKHNDDRRGLNKIINQSRVRQRRNPSSRTLKEDQNLKERIVQRRQEEEDEVPCKQYSTNSSDGEFIIVTCPPSASDLSIYGKASRSQDDNLPCAKWCSKNSVPWKEEKGFNQKCDWEDHCAGCPECFSDEIIEDEQPPFSTPTSSPPTIVPTGEPTSFPTDMPSPDPTDAPSPDPTDQPITPEPTPSPSATPTTSPPTSIKVSMVGDFSLTLPPSNLRHQRSATHSPTTESPTESPSESPSSSFPTTEPSEMPSSSRPTNAPSVSETTEEIVDPPRTNITIPSQTTSPSSQNVTQQEPQSDVIQTTPPTLLTFFSGTNEPSTTHPTTELPTQPPTQNPTQSPTTLSPTTHPTTPLPTTTHQPTHICNNMGREERATQITDIIESITPPSTLSSPASPQSQALDWIINDDVNVYLCPYDDRLVQRYALTVLYFSMNGDGWTDCGRVSNDCDGGMRFLSDKNECDWNGLVCNDDGYVKEIHLDEKGMTGTIPSEISSLTHLEAIDLDDNDIHGTIPASFGRLRHLRILDVDKNVLTGSLPDEFYDLVNLKVLDLNNNRFDGFLSEKIGFFEQLEFFQLHNNFFKGSIPKSLGNLDKLEILTFNGNMFDGRVPDEICEHRNSTLQQLWADCGSRQTIECSCCTRCY